MTATTFDTASGRLSVTLVACEDGPYLSLGGADSVRIDTVDTDAMRALHAALGAALGMS